VFSCTAITKKITNFNKNFSQHTQRNIYSTYWQVRFIPLADVRMVCR